MQITLKRATVANVVDYVEIEKRVESRTYIAITDPNEVLKIIETSDIYVIEKDDKPAGFIGYERKSSDHVNITQVVVDPDFQGQGIGNQAFKLIMRKFRDVKRVDLETHPENRARYLYESHGFKVEGYIENYHDSGEPRLIMVRYA